MAAPVGDAVGQAEGGGTDDAEGAVGVAGPSGDDGDLVEVASSAELRLGMSCDRPVACMPTWRSALRRGSRSRTAGRAAEVRRCPALARRSFLGVVPAAVGDDEVVDAVVGVAAAAAVDSGRRPRAVRRACQGSTRHGPPGRHVPLNSQSSASVERMEGCHRVRRRRR